MYNYSTIHSILLNQRHGFRLAVNFSDMFTAAWMVVITMQVYFLNYRMHSTLHFEKDVPNEIQGRIFSLSQQFSIWLKILCVMN